MRHSFFLLAAAFIIVMLGCSGGGSITAPGFNGEGPSPFKDADTTPAGTEEHHVWGMFEINLDPASEVFNLTSIRQSTHHYDVGSLISPTICDDCVTLEFLSLTRANGIIKFNLALRNPYPNVDGHDVRAIILSDDPRYYLVNADGATGLFDDGGNVQVNSFVAFAKDQPNRIFGAGKSFTETCELHFPPNPQFRALKLIIDASYPGNCKEPYGFSDFSFMGDRLSLRVWDWQDDVDAVHILTTPKWGSMDILLAYNQSDGLWSGSIEGALGEDYKIVGAKLRGQMVSDINALGNSLVSGYTDVRSISATATASSTEGISGIENVPNGCLIKADSGGRSLWGFIEFEIVGPKLSPTQEILSTFKMSKDLLEQYYDPSVQEDEISIIAYVTGNSPGTYASIKANADAAYPRIKEVGDEIKRRYRNAQADVSKFEDDYLQAFMQGDPWVINQYKIILGKYGLGKRDLEPMVRDLESLRERRADYVTRELEAYIAPLQEPAIDEVERINETEILSKDYIVNVIFIKTKVKHIGEIAALDSIEYVEHDFMLSLQLDTAGGSVNAPAMWGAGYTGGTFDVMVFDTGCDTTHPALASHYAPGQSQSFGGSCTTDDTDWGSGAGHGTHCAGIVSSTDALYRGIGYGLDKMYNGKFCVGGNWSAVEQAFAWAGMGGTVADPAETISFSWAWGPGVGCVRDGNYFASRFVDESTYLYDQLWSIAAGNTPMAICSDDNIITMPSDAYNAFAVGNMNDMSDVNRANDAIAGSSRLGPAITPGGETRVKPDICAPGSNIMSCNTNWETGPDFISMTGTSMAAPNVAGATALAFDAGMASSLEVRAMLTNTADDWNSNLAGPGTDGPDVYTGYGYMNLARTLLNIGNIDSNTISQDQYRLYRHSSHSATDTVMVLWDRYVSGLDTYYADIDLQVWDDTTGAALGSQNKTYDNRRYLADGTPNDVIYKIRAENIPSISPTWDYAIAATGGVLTGPLTLPNLNPLLSYVEPMPVSVEVDINATITNNCNFTIRNTQAILTLDTDMTFESGSTPLELGPTSLAPGNNCMITWHVKLNAPSLVKKHISVDTIATAVGQAFTGFAEAYINVVPPDPNLYVHPTSLNFGMVSTVKPFHINNTGGGTVTWDIDDSGFPGWLSVDVTHGTTQDETDTVQVMVNRSGFTPSIYTHDIQVTSDAGDDTVHISMEVPNPLIPQLHIEPLDLYFGEVAIQKNILITNAGGGELNWQIDHSPPNEYPSWLKTNVDYGKIDEMHPQGGVIVTVDRTGLAPGLYTYDMYFTSDGGDAVVHIYMSVHMPVPQLEINIHNLEFGEDYDVKSFIISNTGEAGSVLHWSIPLFGKPLWVNADKYSGAITPMQVSEVTVAVDRTGLNPGDYQYYFDVSSDGGDDAVHVTMSVPYVDLLAPILISPTDEVHYEVGSWIAFTWDGKPGYDGKFWFDAKLDGVPFAPFTNMPVFGNVISVPPQIVDVMLKYGKWEWRVSIIEKPSPPVHHYSDWWTIYKDPPELLTPLNNTVVADTTEFTWNKVLAANETKTWYVAKLTGFTPIDPFYYWWLNTDTAILPPNWYQILYDLGGTDYTWTVAAVIGDPATPGGNSMTWDKAMKIKYPAAWTFHIQK